MKATDEYRTTEVQKETWHDKKTHKTSEHTGRTTGVRKTEKKETRRHAKSKREKKAWNAGKKRSDTPIGAETGKYGKSDQERQGQHKERKPIRINTMDRPRNRHMGKKGRHKKIGHEPKDDDKKGNVREDRQRDRKRQKHLREKGSILSETREERK